MTQVFDGDSLGEAGSFWTSDLSGGSLLYKANTISHFCLSRRLSCTSTRLLCHFKGNCLVSKKVALKPKFRPWSLMGLKLLGFRPPWLRAHRVPTDFPRRAPAGRTPGSTPPSWRSAGCWWRRASSTSGRWTRQPPRTSSPRRARFQKGAIGQAGSQGEVKVFFVAGVRERGSEGGREGGSKTCMPAIWRRPFRAGDGRCAHICTAHNVWQGSTVTDLSLSACLATNCTN